MYKTLTAFLAAAAIMIVVVAVPERADARWRGYGGWGYYGGGVAAGLAAGAIIGGLAANRYYYGPDYYPGPGYYRRSYYGGPRYYEAPEVYEDAPVYVRPAPRYYRNGYGARNGCWIATDTTRGYGYYGPCY